MKTKPIDAAIVGAGVSGVHCAWRLKKAQPRLCGLAASPARLLRQAQQGRILAFLLF